MRPSACFRPSLELLIRARLCGAVLGAAPFLGSGDSRSILKLCLGAARCPSLTVHGREDVQLRVLCVLLVHGAALGAGTGLVITIVSCR